MPDLGETGAGIAADLLYLLATFGGGIATLAVFSRIYRDRDPSRLGCGIGIVVAALVTVLLVTLLGPSIHILRSYNCRHATNFEDCIDPPLADE